MSLPQLEIIVQTLTGSKLSKDGLNKNGVIHSAHVSSRKKNRGKPRGKQS